MDYNPAQLDPNTVYRLMVHSILPRPIAWISTVSADGVANLAPYSFFTVASCNPPVLSVTQVNPRDRRTKDTLTNLQTTGECIVHIVSAALAEAMNATCADYPPGVSEFQAAGIASVPGVAVRVDGVAAAPVRFECRLRQILEISPEPSGGTMMLLDVVHIHVADSVMTGEGAKSTIDPQLLDAVGKMGGNGYAHTRERFDLARPVYKAAT